jgi:SAM-dependent methyltransferase
VPSAAGAARWRAVTGDAGALPFRDRAFDLVLAAFCLNHLDDLAAGLCEARRVGAAIAASMFAPGWTHPAKDAVDEVLRAHGYSAPAWHSSLAPGSRSSDPVALAREATAAGWLEVRTSVVTVRTGLAAPAELAGWRLGMAHVAPFLRSLDAAGAASARGAAERAVAGTGPLDVSMLVLTGYVPDR